MKMDITLPFAEQVLCPEVLGTQKEPHDVQFEYSPLLPVYTHGNRSRPGEGALFVGDVVDR